MENTNEVKGEVHVVEQPRNPSGRNGPHKRLAKDVNEQIAELEEKISAKKRTQDPGRDKKIREWRDDIKHLRLKLEQRGETHTMVAKGQFQSTKF